MRDENSRKKLQLNFYAGLADRISKAGREQFQYEGGNTEAGRASTRPLPNRPAQRRVRGGKTERQKTQRRGGGGGLGGTGGLTHFALKSNGR
jgi:hypothetical protein